MKLRSSVILTCALFGVFNAGTAQSIDEARRLSRNEQYEDADKMFNELIASKPKDYKAYYYGGLNLIEAGDSLGALSKFDKGVEMSPKCLLGKVGQGHIRLKQGDLNSAQVLFSEAALSKKKYQAEIYREIGRAYLMTAESPFGRKNNFAKMAETNFLKSKDLSFEYENELLLGDAYILLFPDNASKAIEQYYNSKSLNEQDPRAVLKEAKVYQRTKNYDAAIDYISQAIALDRDFAPAYRQKADVYAVARMIDSSIFYYKEYLKRNNNPSARRMFIQSLYLAGAYEEAIAEGKALQAVKEYGNIWGIMAYSVAGLNNPDIQLNTEGLEYFNKYEDRFIKYQNRPLSAGENYRKALLMFNTGAIEDAYNIFITAFKDSAGSQTDWYDVAQIKYYKLNLYDESLEILRLKKIKTRTETLNDLYYKGNSLSSLERDKDALLVYKQMVALDSNYISGYFLIAITEAAIDSADISGNAEAAYNLWINKLKPEEHEKFKNDIIGAYYFIANAARTKLDWKKVVVYYKKIQKITPEDEELRATILKLEEYVKYLEKTKKK